MRAVYILLIIIGLHNCTGKTEGNSDLQFADTVHNRSEETKTAGVAGKNKPDPQLSNPIHSTIIRYDTLRFECAPTAYRRPFKSDWFSPGTFNDRTFVYSQPRLNSRKTDTLPFKTPVNILAEDSDFYFVCIPKGRSGYVKKTDLYLYEYGNYLFGITKYLDAPEACGKMNTFKVMNTYNSDVLIDSVSSAHYVVNATSPVALKNVTLLFRLFYLCSSESGASVHHFIVNTDKLHHFYVASRSGDGGNFWGTKIYIPVNLDNGKIVLARNGELTVDQETGFAETFPYSKECGIPIDELVVVVDESGYHSSDQDSGGYNSDGTPKITDYEARTIYYRWNGNSLKKVKTIKNTGK
jgi:hypothetical protein